MDPFVVLRLCTAAAVLMSAVTERTSLRNSLPSAFHLLYSQQFIQPPMFEWIPQFNASVYFWLLSLKLVVGIGLLLSSRRIFIYLGIGVLLALLFGNVVFSRPYLFLVPLVLAGFLIPSVPLRLWYYRCLVACLYFFNGFYKINYYSLRCTSLFEALGPFCEPVSFVIPLVEIFFGLTIAFARGRILRWAFYSACVMHLSIIFFLAVDVYGILSLALFWTQVCGRSELREPAKSFASAAIFGLVVFGLHAAVSFWTPIGLMEFGQVRDWLPLGVSNFIFGAAACLLLQTMADGLPPERISPSFPARVALVTVFAAHGFIPLFFQVPADLRASFFWTYYSHRSAAGVRYISWIINPDLRPTWAEYLSRYQGASTGAIIWVHGSGLLKTKDVRISYWIAQHFCRRFSSQAEFGFKSEIWPSLYAFGQRREAHKVSAQMNFNCDTPREEWERAAAL